MVKKNENNYRLIAVIYLLTADNTLWNLAKEAVKKNAVDFDAIKLNAIHPKGYTLYCAAKDIYLGTRHLTVSDLIDMNLVTPKLFGVITNAMAIRRFTYDANGKCQMTANVENDKLYINYNGVDALQINLGDETYGIPDYVAGSDVQIGICTWNVNEGLALFRNVKIKNDKSNFCTHCGACRKPCEHEECQPFGRCIHVCPNGCLSIAGEEVSANTLAERLQKHADILKLMGGGITISGGEPMLQPDFVCELAERLGDTHKAIQTSGYADLETYKKVVERMDYVLQDIKLADEKEHIKYTGVSNEKILRNIEWLKTSGKPFVFRVPLIPGITDTESNLKAISEIVGDCRTELMPYNPLAGAKYAMIDMEYTLSDDGNRKEDFTKYFQNAVMLG